MKRSYTVQKGLEKPLLLYGVKVEHFYGLLGVGVCLVILILMVLVGLFSGSTSKLSALIEIGLTTIIFFAAIRWARKQAKPKRYHFKNETRFLSNRDLLKYLD